MIQIRDFYVWMVGRSANWIVSVIFILVGVLFAFYLPTIIEDGANRQVAMLIVQVLGGVFFVIGFMLLFWMFVDIYLTSYPDLREDWYFWSSLLGPLALGGLFAVPAMLAFPVLALLYETRPNVVFPFDEPGITGYYGVALIFSLLGLLSLLLLILAAYARYQELPRRRPRTRVIVEEEYD